MAGPTAGAPRVHKRHISDQQKRREIALQRQKQGRRDLQHHARLLALSPPSSPSREGVDDGRGAGAEEEQDVVASSERQVDCQDSELKGVDDYTGRDGTQVGMEEAETSPGSKRKVLLEGTRLRGVRAREFYSQQLMLPEWMVDIPLYLKKDWFIMARPAGQRCLVIAANGITISRQRNGRILHCFPSSLPNGARTKEVAAGSHVYCILDCIFNVPNQTYYVIDMMCWRGYSLYDCTTEFRFFWMTTKLAETGVLDTLSYHHHYQFSVVPVYDCNPTGLQAVYSGLVPFERDGVLFYNRHAHYELGITPLVLVWKDGHCCQYLLDTDSQGNVPAYQQVVLELQSDGSVATSDDPPVRLGSLPPDFLEQNAHALKPGMLVRFAIGDQGLSLVEGQPVVADIHFQGIASNSRTRRADSCTKILFQYAVRHGPLTIQDLLTAIETADEEGDTTMC